MKLELNALIAILEGKSEEGKQELVENLQRLKSVYSGLTATVTIGTDFDFSIPNFDEVVSNAGGIVLKNCGDEYEFAFPVAEDEQEYAELKALLHSLEMNNPGRHDEFHQHIDFIIQELEYDNSPEVGGNRTIGIVIDKEASTNIEMEIDRENILKEGITLLLGRNLTDALECCGLDSFLDSCKSLAQERAMKDFQLTETKLIGPNDFNICIDGVRAGFGQILNRNSLYKADAILLGWLGDVIK